MGRVVWNRMDADVSKDSIDLVFGDDRSDREITIIELSPQDSWNLIKLLVKSRAILVSLRIREKIKG